MVSTSGHMLLPEGAAKAYVSDLFRFSTILTPNIPEALQLTKISEPEKTFDDLDEILESRRELARILAMGCKWVLLKGGHAPIKQGGVNRYIIDILANNKGEIYEFKTDYRDTRNTHGTGCSLSCIYLASKLTVAAIAANIACGIEMVEAVRKAIDFVQGAIIYSYDTGSGPGAINHLFRQRNLPFTPYFLGAISLQGTFLRISSQSSSYKCGLA